MQAHHQWRALTRINAKCALLNVNNLEIKWDNDTHKKQNYIGLYGDV